MPITFSDVLSFWFGAPDSPARGRMRKEWFKKDPAFDEQIREKFLATHEGAAAGKLDAWADTPYGALALIVVLDQFPRNLFRDSPRAFSTDAKALATARDTVERGFDRLLRRVERNFIYLPFEHSEDLATQRRSLALFGSSSSGGEVGDFARRHYEIIARFGRFPHRNKVLGRESTAEEIEFLKQPGSGF
jgi:uncharacterized protein (DUF924 family)